MVDRSCSQDFGQRAAEAIGPAAGRSAGEDVLAVGAGAAAEGDRWGPVLPGPDIFGGPLGAGNARGPAELGVRSGIIRLVHGPSVGPACRGFGKSTTGRWRNIASCIKLRSVPSRCPIWRPTALARSPTMGLDRPSGPERRRLFAGRSGREVLLSDRQGMEAGCRCGRDSDGGPAVEKLQEFRSRGVKIRSRALITTLWARLVLGDLFLHGIGGAKYDQVTDLLIERFSGCRRRASWCCRRRCTCQLPGRSSRRISPGHSRNSCAT